MESSPPKPHIGRNISRIREMLGFKQEALAIAVGMSQQALSLLEKNPNVAEAKLCAIAKALNVSEAAILNFDERRVLEFIEAARHPNIEASPVELYEKLAYALERNSQLLFEIQSLYERLLKSEREKYLYLAQNSYLNPVNNGLA